MKKITVALIAIIYLTVSSGVAMSFHYCMGKVSSVDLMHTSEKCGKCGMKMKDGCCKDEFRIFKISDSHKHITNDFRIFSPVAIIDNSKMITGVNFLQGGIQQAYRNNSPPGPPGISLNILYSVFRI